MKKKLIVGLVLLTFSTFNLHGAATSTPSSRPRKLQGIDVRKKIVVLNLTEPKIKINYLIFENLHQSLVKLCEDLERFKKLKIEDAIHNQSRLLNTLIEYEQGTQVSKEIFEIAEFNHLTETAPNKDLDNFYLLMASGKIPDFLDECIKIILTRSETGFIWYYLISELEIVTDRATKQKVIEIIDTQKPKPARSKSLLHMPKFGKHKHDPIGIAITELPSDSPRSDAETDGAGHEE
ncbi:hypothetical protein K2W90_04615 [Candidatus Babeliales bacterium]|nr:hypothetical protein [Candidatus Babeliales bacterium]